MRHCAGGMLITALWLPVAGCDVVDVVAEFILPSTVTITLVNDSPDFNVETTLFFDGDDDIFSSLLTVIGTERTFIIAPGEVITFSESCDDLQAIVIDDADLRVLVGVGPDTDSRLLRGDDDDFDCGDEIVFTFTHSNLILDFDVDTDVR